MKDNKLKLDAGKLLGFRLLDTNGKRHDVAVGAKIGSKPGATMETRIGAKIGGKVGSKPA